MGIRGYFPHVLGTDAACLCGFCDAVVTVVACEHDEVAAVVALVSDQREVGVACYDQCGEIGRRTAGVSTAACVRTSEAEGVGEFLTGESFDN